MKTPNPLPRLLRAAAPAAFGISIAQAVPIEIPAIADMTVTENDGTDGAGPAGHTDLNSRFNNSTRNEFIVLRFDLCPARHVGLTHEEEDMAFSPVIGGRAGGGQKRNCGHQDCGRRSRKKQEA